VSSAPPRIRRPITELQDDYTRGDTKALEDLWRAWKGIQDRDTERDDSFFKLAGYHGAPFRGAGWGSAQYWGGYCNHGNVLFPTWHRVYVYKLEQALQSVPGCADVMLPYWDETSDDTLANGIPWALTQKTVTVDGQTIDNPLRSFRLPAVVADHVSNDVADYTKPKGYETQRYPRSGLVGPTDKVATEEHNRKYSDDDECLTLLNQNVRDWIGDHSKVIGQAGPPGKVKQGYQRCLTAPNYTVFSNTTSAAEWNDNHDEKVVPLETPHNAVHLAVGGFEVPGQPSSSPISGANGDMGENDTAAFDPIFFFHHCFVDYVFWLWQRRPGHPVEVCPEYPGTNSVDGQNPTPGVAPNSWLDLDSPLAPFRHKGAGGQPGPLFTSRDCLDTETQLGYTYSDGSLSGNSATVAAPAPGQVVTVSGINRAAVRGSFLISVFGTVDGERVLLGTEAVLSRWNVQYCPNCQTHLEAKSYVSVPTSGAAPMAALSARQLSDPTTYELELTTRDGTLRPGQPYTRAAAALSAGSAPAPPSPLEHARLEVQ
jgi:tyrosinase